MEAQTAASELKATLDMSLDLERRAVEDNARQVRKTAEAEARATASEEEGPQY